VSALRYNKFIIIIIIQIIQELREQNLQKELLQS